MPKGSTHNLINSGVYTVLAVGVLAAVHYDVIHISGSQALNFSIAYFAGTFLLSPDLDLAQGRVDSKANWGLLGFIWVPYGKIFKHRGLSHSWFLGPLTRIIYLAVPIVVAVGLFRTFWPEIELPRLPYPFPYQMLFPMIAGYYLSQWLHLIADGVPPYHGIRVLMKRKKSKSRKL